MHSANYRNVTNQANRLFLTACRNQTFNRGIIGGNRTFTFPHPQTKADGGSQLPKPSLGVRESQWCATFCATLNEQDVFHRIHVLQS